MLIALWEGRGVRCKGTTPKFFKLLDRHKIQYSDHSNKCSCHMFWKMSPGSCSSFEIYISFVALYCVRIWNYTEDVISFVPCNVGESKTRDTAVSFGKWVLAFTRRVFYTGFSLLDKYRELGSAKLLSFWTWMLAFDRMLDCWNLAFGNFNF